MPGLLTLVAIVKDEAENIARTLASVRGVVDSWVILDTGSKDGTQQVANHVFADVAGPGLFEEPAVLFAGIRDRFVIDFAATRNRVLEIHEEQPHPSTFTLMLSGDEVLEGGGALREFLAARRDALDGAYSVQMQSGTQRWTYPRVLRTAARWRYEGAVHEVPVGPGRETTGPLVPGAIIHHRVSDPARRARRVRDVDFPILTSMVEDESKSLDERAQTIFFLGQTNEALAADCAKQPGGSRLSYQMAAMALYRRYAQIAEDSDRPGYDPVKGGYARVRYLDVAQQAGVFQHSEMVARLEALVRAYPMLLEARVMLARHMAQVDVRRGLVLAEEAAKVAREARARVLHVPVDDRIEWLALRIGAECARVLKRADKARMLAQRAVEAGGPAEEFAEYL